MENTTLPVSLFWANFSFINERSAFSLSLQKGLRISSMVIYSLAFFLGVIGNGLVIFITGFRMKKTVSIIWFLNLAIADFTCTFFLPLSIAHLALAYQWPFGEVMCKVSPSMIILNLHASVYFLMIISVDRCISVRCPVWARNHRTPRLATFVALGTWILALALCSQNLYFRKTSSIGHIVFCYKEYSSDREQAKIIHRATVINRFILTFAIPFSVIIVCYRVIILQLRRNSSAWSNKPFKVITAVIVAFFICWFPYQVFCFLEVQAHEDPNLNSIVNHFFPLIASLAFINSGLNPILYVFVGREIKERLKRSILSVFENAFSEEINWSTRQKKMTDDVTHCNIIIFRLDTFSPTGEEQEVSCMDEDRK
ncbi:chemerin-like receptor 1 [Heteronotia binoei]|uniref:chemerin-like receptor 1 n=1 Tax=Heteronotia binoei TaxID=13085 RepID=UPI002931EDB1|nr:chemerin-like receptor 1 [Heteronotia binoei]